MSSWNNLSMRQRADIMKLAIDKGIYDLGTIRNAYNEYAMGGPKKPVTTGGAGYIPPIQEPKRKTVYKTPDGKVFQTFKEAQEYNTVLKEKVKQKKERPSYIGGTSQEARQKFFDTDKEFTDSVVSISNRYDLNPELVASRIAREGPIDAAIRLYNGNYSRYPKKTLYSEAKFETNGPAWGLDDIGSRLFSGETKITTSAPFEWYDAVYTNDKGRETTTARSPQWWFGIEATAADLKARRDKLKKNNPSFTDSQLDAAASMSYNYGETGAQNYIDKHGHAKNGFEPFIKIKR